MTPEIAKQILDKIMGQVFSYQNPLSLEQFMQKYAFDVRLPVQVHDSTTGEPTWAQSANPTKFITFNNSMKYGEKDIGFMLEKRPISGIQDIFAAWNEINYTTTERQIDSIDFSESDNVYNSQMVYRSQDINRSKNIIFSDGVMDSEFIAAGQRSNNSTFCARLEDSQNCSNSFSVSWCNKVVNSMFTHDCFDLYECLFCSHLSSKKYCIGNMQFEEEEYFRLKDMVVRWILTS